MKKLIAAWSLVFTFAFVPSLYAQPISFAITPQESALTLAKKWDPVIQYLAEKTGLPLEFRTAKNIETFMNQASAGEYDLVYIGPYIYTVVHESVGYTAFARPAGKLNGILVVAKDSPITKIEELRSKTLAFPAPDSFAATRLPLDNLKKKNIPVDQQYVGSHLSVYLAVTKGLFPAGGGIIATFNALEPEVKNQLRILWTTPEYMTLPFVAHPRLSKDVVKKIRTALISMDDDPRGRELLEKVGFKSIIGAKDDDYDDVRALRK